MLASDIKMVSIASNIVNSQQQLYAAQQLTLTNIKVTQVKIESPTEKSSDDAINNKAHSQPVSQKSQTSISIKNKKSHHSYNRKKYHTYQSQHFSNTTVNRTNMPNNNNNNIRVNKNQGVSEKLNGKNQDSKSGKKYPHPYNTENNAVVPKNRTLNVPSQSANVTTVVKSKSSPKLDTQTQLSTNTTPLCIENRLNPQQQPTGVGTVVAEKDKMQQQDQQDSNAKPKPNKKKYWRNSNTHSIVSASINTNGEIPAKSTVVNPISSNNNNCNNSDKSQLPIKVEVSNKASLPTISQNNEIDNKNVGTIATVPSNNNIITTVEKKVETRLTNDTKDAIIVTTTPSITTEPAKPNTDKAVLQVPDIYADTVRKPTPTAATPTAENSVTKTASTCSLDSSIDSSNTYSLAFLHSVGADITGSKQNKVEIVNDAIKFVVEPPTRQAIITDTNNNTTYKPNRYQQSQNSANDGQQYQQYPYYHHQPSQLTIASFLQKDMLVETTTTTENNKKSYSQQSYTQHHRYQNFPHSNYSAQPHHHQYPAHKNNNGKHNPMHYSNENKMDNYIMRYPPKYHNHNVHTTILQPHSKRTTNTGSISSSSSATSSTTKVISYRRQSHYKFRSHTNSAIETLSTKTFRHQQRHHYNNQNHYNNHYNNYQHNSGGTTPTPNTQHQNFNNLTYVSTDGYIANNMSNVMKSHSRSPLKSASNMYINSPNSMSSKFLNCAQLDAATTNTAGVSIRPNLSVEQKRSNRNINNNCESNDFQPLNYSMPSPKSNSTSASLNSLHNQDSMQRSTHSMKMQTQCRKESDKMCVVHPSYYHHHHHQQHVDRRQHVTNVHHQYYTNSVMPMLNYHAGYYDESYSPAHVIYASSDHSINITNRNWSSSAGNMMYPPTVPNVVPPTVSTGSITTPLPSPRSQEADNKLDRSSSLSSISTTSDTLTLDSTKMSSTSTQDQQQELSEKQQLPHANVQQERPNSSRKSIKTFSTDIRIISTTQILTSIQHIPSQARPKPTIMSLVNNEHEMVYAPSDRYMARAHLVEVKQEPECLLKNSKYDLLSRQIWAKFAECQQTRETFVEKMRLWRYIYILIKLKMKTTYPRYGLYLVGSTISGFGSDISDVDMCLVARAPANQDTRVDALVNLQLLKKCLEEEEDEFEKFNLIEAKVPILRFKQKQNDYEVDLNFNNSVGIKNTHLLYSYSLIDWRVRPLVLVTKLWAQYHNINNAKNMTISSYSLALMVINYLQCGVKPIILPCLHDLYPEKFTFLRIHDFGNVDMNEDIGCSFQSENTQTIGELFLGFLDYYYKFEYGKYAISVRTAGLLPVEVCRQAKSSKNDMHQWKVLCIEEPFDLTNTARSVYDFETFEHIKSIMFNSWRTLSHSLNLNSIFGPLFVTSPSDSEMNLAIGSGGTSKTNSLIPAICEKEPNESTTSNSSHSSEEVSSDSSETSESTLSMLKEIINEVADSSLNTAEMLLQEKKHRAEKSNDIYSNGSSENSSCSGAISMPQNNRNSCKTEPPNLTTIIF
ncbi:poly(A) RNA polymerase gld-2 homolog B-like isoform X2 [Teleopsis dalmanni]|uniref:poly(A) RNA polymerase gld-2 homolog B-like isoform X2 n=1 Tax=Teleopsis dalmanni TaxID=139649 RepID=UPI0018CE778C|nr:poly(A) RNA polymerase gld-2 homolog B-like isoform X2 [Teleopsis dalmanni]